MELLELFYSLLAIGGLYGVFHVLKNIGKKKAKVVKMEQPEIEKWEEDISNSGL